MSFEKSSTPSRCDQCFASKDVQLLFPPVGIACCRSCRYKLAQTIDFLEYYGLYIAVPESNDGALVRPLPEPGDGLEGSPAENPHKLPQTEKRSRRPRTNN